MTQPTVEMLIASKKCTFLCALTKIFYSWKRSPYLYSIFKPRKRATHCNWLLFSPCSPGPEPDHAPLRALPQSSPKLTILFTVPLFSWGRDPERMNRETLLGVTMMIISSVSGAQRISCVACGCSLFSDYCSGICSGVNGAHYGMEPFGLP